jgi:hypothetical protein
VNNRHILNLAALICFAAYGVVSFLRKPGKPQAEDAGLFARVPFVLYWLVGIVVGVADLFIIHILWRRLAPPGVYVFSGEWFVENFWTMLALGLPAAVTLRNFVRQATWQLVLIPLGIYIACVVAIVFIDYHRLHEPFFNWLG